MSYILLRLRTEKGQPDNNRNAIAKRSVLQFNLLNRNRSGCPSPRSETCRAKGNTMQVPSILQGESLKRLLLFGTKTWMRRINAATT